MRRIDSYIARRIVRYDGACRILRQIAKAALVSMLFFSAVLSSSASALAGDGLPPDCCHFISEADTGSFFSDFSEFRSVGRSGSARKLRRPIVAVMIEPSLRRWNFDYRVSDHGVDSAPVHSVAKALAGFGWEASTFRSLLQPRSWCQFELPLETLTELSILQQTLATEAQAMISANLFHQSPLPVRALRLVERAIWEF